MTRDRLQAAEDHLLELLALNIEALRHPRGWSLADVGKRAGVSTSLMNHIVHRRANPSTGELLRIANAFGVTLHDLTAQALEQSFESPRAVPRYDAEEFSIAFGPRLRVYRKVKGISSSQLAASAGIGTSTVQAIEKSSGEHGVKVMARIAAGLNVSYASWWPPFCPPFSRMRV